MKNLIILSLLLSYQTSSSIMTFSQQEIEAFAQQVIKDYHQNSAAQRTSELSEAKNILSNTLSELSHEGLSHEIKEDLAYAHMLYKMNIDPSSVALGDKSLLEEDSSCEICKLSNHTKEMLTAESPVNVDDLILEIEEIISDISSELSQK